MRFNFQAKFLTAAARKPRGWIDPSGNLQRVPKGVEHFEWAKGINPENPYLEEAGWIHVYAPYILGIKGMNQKHIDILKRYYEKYKDHMMGSNYFSISDFFSGFKGGSYRIPFKDLEEGKVSQLTLRKYRV